MESRPAAGSSSQSLKQHMPQRQASLPTPANKRKRPMCDSCEKSMPNQIVFSKIEAIVRRMQDEERGIPVRTAIRFMTKIPSVFTGADLIAWMQRNLRLEDQQEAVHLANLIVSHGYIFPVEEHTLLAKNDTTFYRFQAPCLWPSHNKEPENSDYAVYLCKRTMQAKTRLELADYEAENLARLQKLFSRKWEFIFMEAESQAKVDKKRDKLERKVFDSQERAFWDVHRPVPGCINTTELDIKKACRASKSSNRCEDCNRAANPSPGSESSSRSGESTSEDPVREAEQSSPEPKTTCHVIKEENQTDSSDQELKNESDSESEVEVDEGVPVTPDHSAEPQRGDEEIEPNLSEKQSAATAKRKSCHHHHHHQHHHHPHGHHGHQRHRKCPHGKQIPSEKLSAQSHKTCNRLQASEGDQQQLREDDAEREPVSKEHSSSSGGKTSQMLTAQKTSARRMSECNHMLSRKSEALPKTSDFLGDERLRESRATRKGSLSLLRPSESVDSRALSPRLKVGTAVAVPGHHPPLKATQSVCVDGSPGVADMHIDNLERELDALRLQLDQRAGSFKMSKVTQSYLGYFTQWADYDPFVAPPIPSNPWVSDSSELWDSERQTKDVHFRRVRRWAFCLRELLNDPAGREQFHRFLEKEFSAENLKFWDAVQELKRVPSGDVARRVEAIWCEYLAPDANCPINIDSKSYETSKLNMAKNRNNRYIFDEAAGHVYQLMKNDSYPRYLRSDMYKDYKEASERKRPNQVAFDVFKPQITTLKQKFNF